MATLSGNEVTYNGPIRRQVFQATHRGDGAHLPYMNRSFISFSYGGKFIEDFDLIATINNDRLDRQGYASFEDNVTNYNNLDGQYYWGTHSKPNTLEFTLSTDGIEQKKLDEFLYWFRAGETKELILAEHPNRAILARVSEPPQLSLLPFESKINMTISSLSYKTSTTLYKGDITLAFVMDEPYWYAIQNLLGRKVGDHYIDEWKPPELEDRPENYRSIFASQDALKILYEDGIPLGSMFDENMLLGNKAYAQVKDDKRSLTWDVPDVDAENVNWEESANSSRYACVDNDNAEFGCGTIAGAIVDASGNGIEEIPSGELGAGYFYYSGNAPAFTIITFSFTPEIDTNTGYVIRPLNAIAFPEPNSIQYNTITVESLHKQQLCFTTPNFLTSYNKAVQILKKGGSDQNKYDPESIRETLRDSIYHTAARAYAIHVVDEGISTQEGSSNEWSKTGSDLVESMKNFLIESGNSAKPLTVSFNSQTGEAKGIASYRVFDDEQNDFIFKENIEEDVGDMLRSNYIIIRDRNYPNENGRISAWASSHKEYSHRIYHDMEGTPLNNFSIEYKNMYL